MVAEIKTLNNLQINNQVRTDIFCLSDNFVVLSLKETLFIYSIFFCAVFFLRRPLHSVYTVPLARHNVRSVLKT